MQHNNLPDLNPNGNNNVLQLYGVVLWVCSITLGLITTSLKYEDSIVDTVLEILSKLAPLLSTFFLYIINRKEIDKFFKTLKRKKD